VRQANRHRVGVRARATLSSTGTVKAINVEVFWDSDCTQIVSDIDWGLVEPGENTSNTVYLKNTGNAPLTLNLSCSNWIPATARARRFKPS